MRFARNYARVKVPATSANLGPGFDSLGIALGIWDSLEVVATVSPTEVSVTGEGAGEVPTGDEHLVVRSIRLGLDHVGCSQANFALKCYNRIPHGKGLGSSASAIVAGLLLARGLISHPEALDDATVFTLATAQEGHPDNVAPAVFGGATAAWMDGENALMAPIPTSDDLRLTVCVPNDVLPTEKARAALPAQVPHADAAFNAGRAALLTLALGGRSEYLLAATEDRLHQGYRRDSMPVTIDTVAWLRELGLPAVVSGAGPSILVFAALDTRVRQALAEAGWAVHEPGIAGPAQLARPTTGT